MRMGYLLTMIKNMTTIKRGKDCDGDEVISIECGHLVVFATRDLSRWSLSFAVSGEESGCDWMETLTGFGAFRTIRTIRPAIIRLLAEITKRGEDFYVSCDKRRAKLYSRYLPSEKIIITE